MPKVVSNFFLYKKIWNDVRRRDKSAGFIIVGQTGSGKSWLGLRIAQDLDPTFDPSTRVVYTAEQFMQLVAYGKLKRGQVIIFDELAHTEGGDSRASMSRTNRLLGSIVSTYRQKGLIVIFILPMITQLDKNLRMVSITGYFKIISIDYEHKQTIAAYYNNDLNVVLGKSYNKTPIIKKPNGNLVKVRSFRFDAPSMDLVKVYKKKKMEFVDYIARKAADENSAVVVSKPKSIKELADIVSKDKDSYSINGVLDKSLIQAKLEIGREKANTVFKYVVTSLSSL